MKILHLIDSGGLYGAEVMLLNLMQAQVELGLEPVLASIGLPGEKDKPLEVKARSLGLKVEAFRMRPGPNWPGAIKILRFAWSQGIDLLHTHGYKGDILFGLLPRSLRRLPMVATVHGWTWTRGYNRMRIYEWLDALSLRFADGVILVSEAMRMHHRIKKLRNDRVAVINNGIFINPSNFEPRDLRDDILTFAGQGFTIAAVGRLSREKGFDLLIEVAAELIQEGWDLRLIIMGQGKLGHELEQKTKDLGIAHQVLLTGYVDNADCYFKRFNLFCMPSLTEGLPMVLLEAMAAGLPVVASRVGGIPEVLEHGRAGTLVEPGSSESLRQCIIQVLRNPGEIQGQVEKAAQRVEKLYSSRAMAERYLSFYNAITMKKMSAHRSQGLLF